jgi:hypothetical protein
LDCIAGVTLYGGERAAGLLKLPRAASYHTEYSALSCTVEIVKDVYAAINHINEHGRYDIFSSPGAIRKFSINFLYHYDMESVNLLFLKFRQMGGSLQCTHGLHSD